LNERLPEGADRTSDDRVRDEPESNNPEMKQLFQTSAGQTWQGEVSYKMKNQENKVWTIL